MEKKSIEGVNKRKILFSVILVMIAVAAAIIAFMPFITAQKQEAQRQLLLSELRKSKGSYDEDAVALNCDYATAEKIVQTTGGTLYMQPQDSAGYIRLSNRTVTDVVCDKSLGGYLSYMTPGYLLYPDATEMGSLSDAYSATMDKYIYSRIGMENDGNNIRNITKGNANYKPRVVVIDTGVQYDHEEFLDSAGNTRISSLSYSVSDGKTAKESGYDILSDSDTITPGHGTLVTGIIFASGDNGKGIAGLAEEVELIVVKMTLGESGGYVYTDFLSALDYAITLKPDVVNLSLGAYNTPNYYTARLKTLKENGAVIVGAAGNSHISTVHYPSADTNVVGVGAFDNLFSLGEAVTDYPLASYSSFGDKNVDICAPGRFYSTKVGNTYGLFSGTSFASPVVASAVALYKSLYPDDTPDEIIARLYASADDQGDRGKDYMFGYGGLNVWDFLFGESGTVSFDDGMGNITSENFIIGKALQTYPFPTSVPNGKAFDGWYLDEACTNPVSYYTEIFKSGATVYAKWSDEPSDLSYDYTFDLMGQLIVKGYYGGKKELFLPEKLNVEGEEHAVKGVAAKAFYNSDITKIVLPETVESIGEYAFYNIKFEYLYLPSSLTDVGNYIVYASTGRLYAQAETYKYGNSDWESGTKMEIYQEAGKFTYSEGMELIGDDTYTLLSYGGTAKELVLQADLPIVTVYDGAFAENKTLDSVSMPDVTNIGIGAFKNSSVKRVGFPSVTEIAENAFESCALLHELALPGSLVSIGNSAFKDCIYLYNIDFSSAITLETIGNNAFDGCTRLQSVDLSGAGALYSVGREAFKDCENLFLAYLPDCVHTVDYNSFGGCTALTVLRLPFIGRTSEVNETSTHFGYIFGTVNVQYQKTVVPSSLRYVYVGKSDINASALDNLTDIIFFAEGEYSGAADCTVYQSGGYSVILFYADDILCGMYGGQEGEELNDISTAYFVPAGYRFVGWENLPAALTDATVSMLTEPCDYVITFTDYDGEVLSENTYSFGEFVEEPLPPVRESDQQYDYIFIGWDSTVGAVSENKTYKAVYNSYLRNYVVTFISDDGSLLLREEIDYGEMPQSPAVSDRVVDEIYYDRFVGWDREISPVTEDVTYTAVFERTKRVYTISFTYTNGTVFATQNYTYGESIVSPDTARADDEIYSYTFIGWETEFQSVRGDASYVALYSAEYIEYTVRFLDYDGKELSSKIYHYGDTVALPADPSREATADYSYTFIGWSPEVGPVTGDVTYTAVYSETSLLYTVIFKNYDGTLLSEAQYHAGDTVTVPEETPQRIVDSKLYYYEFIGWNSEIVPVTESTEYKAVFERKYYQYRIVFKDYDDTVLSSVTYQYNATVAVPDDPVRDNYTFVGWSPAVVRVEGDATYIAVYAQTEYPENDAFKQAVSELQELDSDSLSLRFSAISKALVCYQAVTDKEAVAAEYAILQDEIRKYNTDAQQLNSAAEQAEENAFDILAGVTVGVSVLAASAFVSALLRKGGMI